MKKSFSEVLEEIKEGISVSKKGKPVRSFSRTDFDKLLKALLNEPGYEMEQASSKKGELELRTLKPVEQFRTLLRRVLLDFHVDKQEADRVLDASYEITNVSGLYELMSEIIYKYVEAGKKFDFVSKSDFVGSIVLSEVEEEVKENTHPTTKEVSHTKNGKHKKIKAKSSAPSWVKTRVDKK